MRGTGRAFEIGNTLIGKRHAQGLRESGISTRIIRARGYETVRRDDAGLDRLIDLNYKGLTLFPERRPGLLVPSLDLDGRVWGHQYRPDVPRPDPRRPRRWVKYENVRGATLRLDFPPGTIAALADREAPLIVTEGVKKADAASTSGYPAIALLGVTIWRTLACRRDWDSILPVLRKREVFICFDSDAVTKAEVQTQERNLGLMLSNDYGARVEVCRLAAIRGGGAKVGLDDYLAAGGNLNDLLADAAPLRAVMVTT